MRRSLATLFATLTLTLPAAAAAPVAARAETPPGPASGQVRQFAFDGDAATAFVSAADAGAADHFTLLFDRAVAVKSVAAATGRPKGGDALDAGTLEVSEDGKKFEA